jgi:hypothetical protein
MRTQQKKKEKEDAGSIDDIIWHQMKDIDPFFLSLF